MSLTELYTRLFTAYVADGRAATTYPTSSGGLVDAADPETRTRPDVIDDRGPGWHSP